MSSVYSNELINISKFIRGVNMRNKRTLTIAATVLILAGIAAVGLFRFWPQQVRAFNPQPDPPGYGLVGITNGQTLRITVINTGDPPEPDTPNPARVVLNFRDGNGNLFRNPDGSPIRRIALLKGGESTSLDLNADNFVRGNGRLTLRPDIRIQQADPVVVGDRLLPPDPCIPSVEVIDNNGRTQFMMPFIPAVQRTTAN